MTGQKVGAHLWFCGFAARGSDESSEGFRFLPDRRRFSVCWHLFGFRKFKLRRERDTNCSAIARIVLSRDRTMGDDNEDAVKDASRKVEATIVQLKSWLEEIVEMRVECAKLEFNMLSLYHTVCPEVLNGLRDDLHDASLNENPSRSNQENDAQ